MSLTSQLITETFPRSGQGREAEYQAFPEEGEFLLSELHLRYTDNDDANFSLYNEKNL